MEEEGRRGGGEEGRRGGGEEGRRGGGEEDIGGGYRWRIEVEDGGGVGG